MDNNAALDRAIFLVQLASFSFLTFAFFWWLAVIPSIDFPARLILDISDWPIDGGQSVLNRDARFLSAIGSGLLAGFSFFLLCVVVPELRKANSGVVRGAVLSVLAWYFVDSLGCALLGIYSNVFLNTLYAGIIITPLLLASHAIKSAGE